MTVAEEGAYGYDRKRWETAKEKARLAIIERARSGQDITYGELASMVRSIAFGPHDHVFHLMLGEISEEEGAAGRGMLTALVVYQDERKPGPGFWDLAKRLGRNTRDRDRFWIEEFRRVVAAWKN